LERAEARAARWLPRAQGALASVGVLVAAILAAMLWLSRGIASTNDISSLMQSHPTNFYRVAMSDFMDLTPQSFADLRHQAFTALVILLLGLMGAWVLRRGRRALAANITMACTLGAFFLCANWALGVFTPRLSSEPLAKQILEYCRPGDKIALYGEYDAATSVGFYTRKQILIFNGRYNGLEFGSYYPDAPHIFFNDHTFWPLWNGPERVFLIVPSSEMDAVRVRMPAAKTFVFAEYGDKTVYVNHQVLPSEPTLAELKTRPEGAAVESAGPFDSSREYRSAGGTSKKASSEKWMQ
jgi:hypothetical protein